MTRTLDQLALDVSTVIRGFSHEQLAVLLDATACELVKRQVVGAAACAIASRNLRRRADEEASPAPAIFSTDCAAPPPP